MINSKHIYITEKGIGSDAGGTLWIEVEIVVTLDMLGNSFGSVLDVLVVSFNISDDSFAVGSKDIMKCVVLSVISPLDFLVVVSCTKNQMHFW